MFQTDAVNRSCKWYDSLKMIMMFAFPADVELESAKDRMRGVPWVSSNDLDVESESRFAFFHPKGHAAWVEAKRAKRASSPAPADLSPLRLPADSPPPAAPVRQAEVSKPKEEAVAFGVMWGHGGGLRAPQPPMRNPSQLGKRVPNTGKRTKHVDSD